MFYSCYLLMPGPNQLSLDLEKLHQSISALRFSFKMVMGSEEESLLLKWDKFDENVKQSFTEFQDKGYFFDVTLACEDKEVKAHKLILSACSPFFKRLLLKKHVTNNLHPVFYLRGVKADQLDAVLAFIYQGEVSIIININIIRITSIIISININIIVKVNIKEEELDSFMLLAKDLKDSRLCTTRNQVFSTKV